MAIYVETFIRCSLDDLWSLTQEPDHHARWDLRFTDIRYLPKGSADSLQRFLYRTRIGGLAVQGEGESIATRHDGRGGRTSSLRFWSDHPLSLIRTGSGYWRYEQGPGGVRFLTRYDYRTRFGRSGALLDRIAFRPLLGWATAWSFDRLRLWLEDGVDPRDALRRSAALLVGHLVAGLTLGLALRRALRATGMAALVLTLGGLAATRVAVGCRLPAGVPTARRTIRRPGRRPDCAVD